MSTMSELFLGKEVQIYPGDSRKKFGTVLKITDAGVVFRITRAGELEYDPTYTVGSVHFIAYSARLTFSLAKNG